MSSAEATAEAAGGRSEDRKPVEVMTQILERLPNGESLILHEARHGANGGHRQDLQPGRELGTVGRDRNEFILTTVADERESLERVARAVTKTQQGPAENAREAQTEELGTINTDPETGGYRWTWRGDDTKDVARATLALMQAMDRRRNPQRLTVRGTETLH